MAQVHKTMKIGLAFLLFGIVLHIIGISTPGIDKDAGYMSNSEQGLFYECSPDHGCQSIDDPGPVYIAISAFLALGLVPALISCGLIITFMIRTHKGIAVTKFLPLASFVLSCINNGVIGLPLIVLCITMFPWEPGAGGVKVNYGFFFLIFGLLSMFFGCLLAIMGANKQLANQPSRNSRSQLIMFEVPPDGFTITEPNLDTEYSEA